jgi:glycosyltransferase involved in cell wall biosynthesis
MNPKVKVLIPILNEAETAGIVVERCYHVLKDFDCEVIVIEGYSTNGSAEISRKAGATVIRQRGEGHGDAYLTGFEYVLERNTDTLIVMIDGDLTYPPEEIPSGLDPSRMRTPDNRYLLRGVSHDAQTMDG